MATIILGQLHPLHKDKTSQESLNSESSDSSENADTNAPVPFIEIFKDQQEYWLEGSMGYELEEFRNDGTISINSTLLKDVSLILKKVG